MQLTVRTAEDKSRSLRLLGGTWFLGRSSENDIVLEDDGVGLIQANLTHGANGWKIANLDPSVPLLHNGTEVVSAIVGDGDVLRFGPVVLEFGGEAGDPEASSRLQGQSASTILELDVKGTALEWAQRDPNLALVADLANVIAAGSDIEAVLDRTVELLRRAFGARAQRGLIATCSESGQDIVVRRSFRHGVEVAEVGAAVAFDMSKTLLEKVTQDRRAVLSADVVGDQELTSASIADLGIRSVLAVPICYEDRLLGFVYMDSVGEQDPVMREDLGRAALVAGAVGALLEGARMARALSRENLALKDRIAAHSSFITSSRQMDSLVRDLTRVAKTDATVLLIGESGTGKEMAARTLHLHSDRAEQAFIAVNCAAIPDTLIESELFGYAPTSGISGSDPAGKPGKFELADGGTILLDEIGDMAPFTQSKLLRVLQEREIERLGATRSQSIDVRVVSATNKDLVEAVSSGSFREDLYYRLNEIELHIPPLRQRKDEILPLAMHFARVAAGQDVAISEEAREILLSYPWPGNVRELKGCMKTAVILGDGKSVRPSDIPERIRKGKSTLRYALETLEQIERRHIICVLQELGGNKEAASKTLGIARDTLYRKLKKYEVQESEYKREV